MAFLWLEDACCLEASSFHPTRTSPFLGPLQTSLLSAPILQMRDHVLATVTQDPPPDGSRSRFGLQRRKVGRIHLHTEKREDT